LWKNFKKDNSDENEEDDEEEYAEELSKPIEEEKLNAFSAVRNSFR